MRFAVVVLFGGNFGGTTLGDTWEFNGVTWTLQSPTGAPGAPALDRAMGLLQATATNVISMVGVGPFLTIPFMFEPVARGIIPMTAAQRVVLPMPLRPITATPSVPIARLTPSSTCAWP